jgi:aryl-alcohol dehydrogenase-like predicted oxidoreductase
VNDTLQSDTLQLTLGSLRVARLGFGAMRLTGHGIIGPPPDRDECRRVLRRALELGVNFIDTASAYGPYVSEEIIAEALYPYPPELVIATKAGLERPGPFRWIPNGRPEYLRAECEGSLQRLRLERIPLFQLHRVDRNVPEADQFGALEALVAEGKVQYIGLSEVGSDVMERARRTLPLVSVQNKYNVADRTWDATVDYCERERLAFIPWYPLGAGALPRPGLAAVAARHKATPLQIAIAWLLARSPVMLPIPGTSKVAHLEENLAAAEVLLTREDLRELEQGTEAPR